MRIRLGGPLTPQRTLVYLFSFFLPPLLFGTFMSLAVLKDLVFQPKASDEKQEQLLAFLPASKPVARSEKSKTALILLGEKGTQISDLMVPFEIFSRAENWQVFTIAKERKPLPTTGHVSVIPDLTFANAPVADAIIIPAILDHEDPYYAEWIKERARYAAMILSLCEGTRVLANTGLLHQRAATSHFLALEELQEKFPTTEFIPSERVIKDGKIITSRGVTASIDATLRAISQLEGAAVAEKIKSQIGWSFSHVPTQIEAVHLSEALLLLLRGGFDWANKGNGIWIFDGMSEIGLAALSDTLPRSLSQKIVSFAEKRIPISTQHGLHVLPAVSFDETPLLHRIWIAPRADQVTYSQAATSSEGPSHSPSPSPAVLSAPMNLNQPFEQAFAKGSELSDLSGLAPAQVYEHALSFLAKHEGENIARFVGKLIEFPEAATSNALQGTGFPAQLWIRPIIIAFLGLFFCWRIDLAIYLRKPQKRGRYVKKEA